MSRSSMIQMGIKYIKTHEWLQSVLWVCLFILLWCVVSEAGLTNQYLFPPFPNVMREFAAQLTNGKFIEQIRNSFIMIIYGFSVSIIAATILVILCSCSKVINSMIRTISVIFTPLPGVAIMPLIIMIFGIQKKSMIVLMVHSVLWPLVINILGGIRTIPKVYTEFGDNLELSRFRMFCEIYLFSIMPHILSGLRIGWGRAWRALISAEMVFGMIGNLGGIGYFIYTNRAYGNMTRVMVGVLAVIVMGIFVESAFFGMIEKMTIKKWGM